MKPKKISKQLLKRLPIYLAYLKSLPEDSMNISATVIAKALDMGDVQVRKDLARVSDGGRCKTGHPRKKLIQDIEDFLDFAIPAQAIIVGVGKLGQALLDFGGFDGSGLDVVAGFDVCPKASLSQTGKPIYPMIRLKSYCADSKVRVGIITVPGDSAQQVCDYMVSCGIRAIWNFAPVQLNAPDHVIIQSENLASSASTLRLQLMKLDASGQPDQLF
jgi:redox-sensing transcriptional repressor